MNVFLKPIIVPILLIAAGCQMGESQRDKTPLMVGTIKSSTADASYSSIQASTISMKSAMSTIISESKVEDGVKALLSRYDGKMVYNANINDPKSIRYLDDPATFVFAELVSEGQIYRKDFLDQDVDVAPLQKDVSGLLQTIPLNLKELDQSKILPSKEVATKLYQLERLQMELDGTSAESALEHLVRMHDGQPNHPAIDAALMLVFEGQISPEHFTSALKNFSSVPDESLQNSTSLFKEELEKRSLTDPRLSFLKIAQEKRPAAPKIN